MAAQVNHYGPASVCGRVANRAWRELSHSEELLRAFRVGPDDLAANRAGRLGPAQVRRLRRNIWINMLAITPFQLGLLVAVPLAPRRPVVLFVMVGLLLAALLAMEVAWVRWIVRALRANVVICLAGPVAVHAGRGGAWLTVQGERNRLWTGYWHVGQGAEYRVYVAPAAKLIIAMEPDGWDQPAAHTG